MSALIRQRAARCASPAFSLSARRFPPTFLWLLLFSAFPKALRYQRLINSRSDGGRRRNANLFICLFSTLHSPKCTMLMIYPILTLTESKPTSGWLTLWAVAVELLSVHRCDWMPPLLCTHWSLRIIPELIALLFCSSTDEQFRWNAQGKNTHAHMGTHVITHVTIGFVCLSVFVKWKPSSLWQGASWLRICAAP